MVAFVKFECYSEHLAEKVHDLNADTLKVYATNIPPNVATMTVKADLAEITAANGYPAGGTDVQNATSRAGMVTSVTAVDVTWTASGGSFGPLRYIVLYNDTPTSPADPLIGFWDYASSISINDTESFTTDFATSILTVT
jgi:hypothetical protein